MYSLIERYGFYEIFLQSFEKSVSWIYGILIYRRMTEFTWIYVDSHGFS